MSQGSVHDKVTWYLLIPFTGFCWSVTGDFFQSCLCSASFLFSGLMFGPDLDTKSKQYKRWGFLRFIWIPYQKFGGHRSFLNQSHDSIFGPLFRFLYLLFIVSLLGIGLAFCLKIESKAIFQWFNKAINEGLLEIIGLFFLGTWLGSLSHQLTDWVHSWGTWSKNPRNNQKSNKKFSWNR